MNRPGGTRYRSTSSGCRVCRVERHQRSFGLLHVRVRRAVVGLFQARQRLQQLRLGAGGVAAAQQHQAVVAAHLAVDHAARAHQLERRLVDAIGFGVAPLHLEDFREERQAGRGDELMGFPDGLDGQVERLAGQRFRLRQPALPRQCRGQLVHLVGDARMSGPGRGQADRQCAAVERFRFGVAAAAHQASEAVQAVEQPHAVIAEVPADEIDAVADTAVPRLRRHPRCR